MIIKQIWSYFNKFKNLIKSNSGIIDELNSPKTTIRLHILQSNVSLPEYQVCNLNSTLMFCLQHLPIDCLCVSQYFKKTSLIIDLITSLYAKLGLDFFQILFKMRKKYPLKLYDRIKNDNMIDCLQMLICKIIILGGRTYSNLIT